MAEAFLAGLPTIPASDLPADSSCIICLESFDTSPFENTSPEYAVRLPCNHIVGNVCIANWLDPNKSSQDTCPYCRAKLFHPEMGVVVVLRRDYERIRQGNIGMTVIRRQYSDPSSRERREPMHELRYLPPTLNLRLHETPAGHPRHTLRRRELELYERLRREGTNLAEPEFSELEALDPEWESDLYVVLEGMGAFDAIPEFMRARAEEGQWDACEKWDQLQWEGYVWCPGLSENGEGRERGWYVD